MPEIVVETEIDAPVERCFDLARCIDLHCATQKRAVETAVGERTRGLLGAGDTVTWRSRHFLVTWSMTMKVVAFAPPRSYRDVALRGPFARFEHDHVFVPSGAGAIMIDRIAFASPLGPLGRLVDRLVLRRYVARLLGERAEAIKVCAETALGDRFLAGRLSGSPR
ncbi:MAG: SRPBCC family protein [Planctomycetota bacterium]